MPFDTAGELLDAKPRMLVTISPEAGVGSAVARMKEMDIGFLPVLDGARLAGVVTERDIVRGVHVERPTFVRDIMSTRVHVVAPESSVPECLAVMHRERIRHLPVVREGELLGVLSVRDLMGSLVARHERLLRHLEQERAVLLAPNAGSY